MPLALLNFRRVWELQVLGAKALIEKLLVVDQHLLCVQLLLWLIQRILILSVFELFHNFLIEFDLPS